MYLENPKKFTKNILECIIEFRNVGRYKAFKQNQLYFDIQAMNISQIKLKQKTKKIMIV